MLITPTSGCTATLNDCFDFCWCAARTKSAQEQHEEEKNTAAKIEALSSKWYIKSETDYVTISSGESNSIGVALCMPRERWDKIVLKVYEQYDYRPFPASRFVFWLNVDGWLTCYHEPDGQYFWFSPQTMKDVTFVPRRPRFYPCINPGV